MEIKNMTIEELEARKAAIATECDAEGADAQALLEEIRAINAELESRKNTAAAQEEIRKAVANGAGEIKKESKEERKMENIEIRNSAAYIDAFANYIKTGKDAECRSLLTENAASGTVPIPELVEEIVRTAWEKDDITRFVKKSYVKGNLKVGFEISSTGATVHAEGGEGVSEEELVLGVVNLIPANIKKWISISDEAMDLRGEAFLRYIYDELAYRIAHKAGEELIDAIIACPTTATSTCVNVSVYTSTQVKVGLVAQGLGQLSDQCTNPVVIMNKATWAEFKEAQYNNKFSVDPFEGLPVLFNNHITSFAAATTGVTYAIVGDLGYGALANFPNGEEIKFTFDDITLATSDLVKVIGREFVAIEPVAPSAFCKIIK